MPPVLRFVLLANYSLLNVSPLFLGFSFLTFKRLSREKQIRFLEKTEHSRLSLRRDMLRGVRALIQLYYFDHPDVRSEFNYDIEAYVAEKQKERKQIMGNKYRVTYQ